MKVLGRPDGWKVGCEAGKVSVTAPAEGTRATADSSTDVSLLAVLNNGLSCVVRMEVGIDGSAAPVARQLDAPVLTAGAATATSVTVNWTPDANASGYLYKVNGGTEQSLGKTGSVTVTELTAETAYTVAVKAAGDGTNYTDSEWASIEVRTTATGTVNPEPAVETLTLDAKAMSEAGLGLPTGKTGLVAGSPNSWSWEDIGFESYLALATSANAAAVKVPVLYFYKAATAGDTTLRNTTPLGEIVKITVNLIDNGLKKGSIFTMTANAGATETAVLSSNDNVKATEHVYTFPAGNNGMFSSRMPRPKTARSYPSSSNIKSRPHHEKDHLFRTARGGFAGLELFGRIRRLRAERPDERPRRTHRGRPRATEPAQRRPEELCRSRGVARRLPLHHRRDGGGRRRHHHLR